MHNGKRAVSKVKNSLAANSTSHLWISEAHLSEAFTRFACSHRRHGSNVPGPLEARRRAAKRRNTDLAFAGAAVPTSDSTSTFGLGKQEGWSQRQTNEEITSKQQLRRLANQDEIRTTLPFLPKWLFSNHEIEPDHIVFRPEAEVQEYALYDQSSKDGDAPRFYSALNDRLRSCTELHQILSIIADAGINLRQHPDVSKTTVQTLLSVNLNPGLLAEVICEPLLNPPGSQISLDIVNYFACQGINIESWKHIHTSICRANQLGLVSAADLQGIIESLPQIKLDLADVSDPSIGSGWWHRNACELLEAWESCPVLGLSDLDHSFLSKLCRDTLKGEHSSWSLNLLVKLQPFLRTSRASEATEILLRGVKSRVQKDKRLLQFLHQFLGSLDMKVRAAAILSASDCLVHDVVTGGTEARTLSRWQRLLSSFDADSVRYVSQGTWWKENYKSSPTEIDQQQRLLVRAWTVLNLSRSIGHNPSVLDRPAFQEDFAVAFRQPSSHSTDDLLGRIVLTLQCLPLPGKNDILRQLHNLTAGQVVVRTRSCGNLPEGIEALIQRNFRKLREDSFYLNARTNYIDAVTELAESINIDLPYFRRLSRVIVLNDKTSFKIITRLLKHNQAMKLAIFKAWPGWHKQRAEVMQQSASLPIKNENASSVTQDLDPAEVLSLLNDLALAFAASPAVKPLSALRKTYWCYLFLHRYGAPIQPQITRALWHAGVTRKGRLGAPATFFKWLASLVREVEGEEVLKLLLNSAGFRDKARDEILLASRNPT